MSGHVSVKARAHKFFVLITLSLVMNYALLELRAQSVGEVSAY